RRWDIWAETFADAEALWTHLEGGIGRLMLVSVRALGIAPAALEPLRGFAAGAALAKWFEAVPMLTLRERPALPDPRPEAIAQLAREGLSRIAASRRQRRGVPKAALPALLAGWEADALLKQAARDPAAVVEGRLALSEAHRRWL